MWKVIPGLEDYAASDDGQIKALFKIREGRLDNLRNHRNTTKKSQRKYKEHIIKQIMNCGYMYVCLTHNGIKKSYRVHRLIYQTFVGFIPENMVIDHIDGNKCNNNILNLRCVTPSENVNNPNTYYNRSKRILQIHPVTKEIVNIFKSIKDAETFITGVNIKGIVNAHIGDCCRGKRRISFGYMWQFEDDYNSNNIQIKEDYRKPIIQYDKNNNFVAQYSSIKEAATINNYSASCIQKCAADKLRTYKNYIWKYL